MYEHEQGFYKCPLPIVAPDREHEGEGEEFKAHRCEGNLSVKFEGWSVPYVYQPGDDGFAEITESEPEMLNWRVECEMGHVLVIGNDEDRSVPFFPAIVREAVEAVGAVAIPYLAATSGGGRRQP